MCGDGILSYSESCEDGNTIPEDGCSPSCELEEGWELQEGWQRCNVTVQLTKCGDGVVMGHEVCDDGNVIPFDGCSSVCEEECGWECKSEPFEPSDCSGVCGDNMIRGKEICDDGNTVGGDGCSEQCSVEAGYACGGAANFSVCGGPGDACSGGCGEGSLSGFEECDDGSDEPGDGCSASCRHECGWTCARNADEHGTCNATMCGDKKRAGGEQCDDGNTISGKVVMVSLVTYYMPRLPLLLSNLAAIELPL
jgi:cysteine-rich repeat protein